MNTDVFRGVYRELSESEKETVATIKRIAAELYVHIDGMNDGREKSVAKTKLEEAVMWAVKGITG